MRRRPSAVALDACGCICLCWPSVLQEALHRLTADIRDKVEALEVDLACLSLTTDSPLISLKTQPAGSPAG